MVRSAFTVAVSALCLAACAASDGDEQAEGSSDAVTDVATTCNASATAAGDTHPCVDLRYPADAFAARGGRVLDVKARFGAKGDGVTDDTAAIRAAYDYVVGALAAVGWDGFFQKTNEASFVLYFPDGTYRVRDSIVYSGATRFISGIQTAEAALQLRFVGQSREHTILRLDDASPGFGSATSPKPVLAFGKSDFNNAPASNSLRNMTIEVGARNPGAVGVYFGGANQSDIHNVSIVSEDGGGVVGLDDSIGTVLSYQRDLTVRGFDVGVRMVPYHFTEPALEHVTLRGQRRAGVELVNGTASLRWVDSVNSAPAVLVSDGGAHVVVLDSSFRGGATSAAAVTLSAGPNGIGHAFVRDVTVGGYGCGARTGNRCARAGSITGASCTDAEWSSDAPLRFSSTRPSTLCSLRLPVVEPPVVPVETDARRWSAPSYTAADFEAGRNASPSVQAAMTAGCPAACPTTVYLPAYAYALDTTVTIPCSVKRVTGLFTKLGGAAGTKLRVAEACSSPLVIEDITFEGGTAVEHAAMRPLVMERVDTQAFVYDSAVASGRPRVWLDMVGGFKALRPFHDVEAYVRAGNAESHVGSFVADANAKLWVLGFKTEKDPTQFTVRNGGQLEVLGGIFNQYCQSGCDFPSSVAVDVSGAGSKVSIVAATNGPPSTTQHFHTIIAETQGSTTRTLAWDDPALPRRAGRAGQIIVPLYASY